jgi:DNA-binding LytR/AlgR family response regulator
MNTKVLVAEDEYLMRDRLLGMLQTYWPQAHVVAVAENGNDAWDSFLEHEPDVVFLDIRMPGLSGLDVAQRIGDKAHVVFVTAYDQYAVSAFEAGAVDYLVKPVEPLRLEKAVSRLRQKLIDPPPALHHILRELKAALPMPRSEKLVWLKATVGKQIKLIDVSSVLYFQSDTKYTRVVLPDFEAFIRTPIKDLLGGLDESLFWQIHRSTVVNVKAIAGVQRSDTERMEVAIKGKEDKLTVSRAFTHHFRE